MKKVTNTATETLRDPMSFLLSATMPGAVERQEAQGQRELSESNTLPRDFRGIEALIAHGLKIIGPVEGDELFQYVELPKGWKIQPTSHSMHSDLLDDKGRKRAGIFYKAAFYDRKAHGRINARFQVEQDWEYANKFNASRCHVVDRAKGNEIIHTTETVGFRAGGSGDGMTGYQADIISGNMAQEWLKQNYPDWEDAAAYWD